MNDLKDEIQNPVLLKVIKGSISDARDTIQKLAYAFKDNVLQIRHARPQHRHAVADDCAL